MTNTEKLREEQDGVTRVIQRKSKNPQANLKNYADENKRMGVTNEVDLLLGEMERETARQKYENELIKFSSDVGVVKKDKETRYLTIQGLLEHPYFIAINEADISTVIDEFEKLQQPNYDN